MLKTIHTHRTIMFAELEKVMDFSFDDNNFKEALASNVTGKKSQSGIIYTLIRAKTLPAAHGERYGIMRGI